MLTLKRFDGTAPCAMPSAATARDELGAGALRRRQVGVAEQHQELVVAVASCEIARSRYRTARRRRRSGATRRHRPRGRRCRCTRGSGRRRAARRRRYGRRACAGAALREPCVERRAVRDAGEAVDVLPAADPRAIAARRKRDRKGQQHAFERAAEDRARPAAACLARPAGTRRRSRRPPRPSRRRRTSRRRCAGGSRSRPARRARATARRSATARRRRRRARSLAARRAAVSIVTSIRTSAQAAMISARGRCARRT